MQLPFFYKENLRGDGEEVLAEETSRHIVQVLRKKDGDSLQLTDGKGKIALANIIKANKKGCEVRILKSELITRPARNITIAISPVKNTTRFEWFLEKATEIGVSEIIPLLCERTERERFRHERMNAIIVSAMLQSQQAWLPILREPITFPVMADESKYERKYIAHCNPAEKRPLAKEIVNPDERIIILIGPEGDLTDEEIRIAINKGYHPVSLGTNRLRTETAGVVAVTILNHLSLRG